ncbi:MULTISPECIES: hypothetical protein [unclassified Nocardiopsis]|uniref:hypothetical protein n=1 Tax=unclassified Nocardiopsis TaxID=2649073 RepID=UPI0037FCAE5F
MMTRHPEGPMRILALLVYTCTAAWVTWIHRDTPWAVIHITGAIAGLCATGLAVSYAGALGEITPDDAPDEAEDYMREGWDD